MSQSANSIIWTKVDEAPQLASYSLLPIVRKFLASAGVEVESKDISLAGRILAQFPELLSDDQQVPDYLTQLGELTGDPNVNIIKLPNISASVPQLKAAISELQDQGFDIPDYPETPETEAERQIVDKYSKVLGSAVNPVLRQGNSDRRAPESVKNYARKHPHRMGDWTSENPCRVVSMSDGDFYAHEESVVMERDDTLTIELIADGQTSQLASVPVLAGEIVDGSFMSVAKLRQFYAEQIDVAKDENLLLSLHLKATMMKTSDPVIFGHAVEVFCQPVFDKYGEVFAELGINPNLGLGDLQSALENLPADTREEVQEDLSKCFSDRPGLAMVDSDNGITNLHAPNLIIIDASMPVVIRDSGQMWNADGKQQPTLAMIPDRSYSGIFQAAIDDCKANGKFDPTTMGSVSNVGLMAQKAEEYGSHATTFIIENTGTVQVKNAQGDVLISQQVETGDIWRMSRVRDLPVRDWVKLGVRRARATGAAAVFFLDPNRAHDRNVQDKVERYLAELDTEGLDIRILPTNEAMQVCLDRIRQGLDTISVTGNILRDYLTDLFPILEIGTSAKMLSIVPLLEGGGVYETGAGGSAPKHVQQFVAENYLRWDSLGEFMALVASLEQVAEKANNQKAGVLAKTLDSAIGKFLDENRSPARKLGYIDNRGSHFYLAKYWAEALGAQTDDAELASEFSSIAGELATKEEQINAELIQVQGEPVDLGGYYHPNSAKVQQAMRPSTAFNSIIDAV